MNKRTESRREDTTTTERASDLSSERDRDTDREILAVLAAESPRHVIDIASTTDRHPITVDQTCARLYEHGQIYPVGRGLYEITDDGKRRIGDGSES